MIKPILTVAIIATSLFSFGQSFSGMYPFTSVVGTGTASTGTLDPTPTPTATGVTFGSFTAVGTGTNSSSNGVFSFNNWGTGATNGNDATFTGSINVGQYYDVSITPVAGYQVDLTSITFNMNRSSTGPRNWAVRSNRDSYANNLPASVGTNTNISVQMDNSFLWTTDTYTTNVQQKGNTITLSGVDFTSQTSAYEFRFYAWNAEGTAGTFRIDTVIFNGTAALTTGIGNVSFDLNSGINVYPMPNHDGIIYIDNNISDLNKIEVFDILGNLIATQNINNDNKKLKLNLSELNTGNYFIRFTANNKISTKKIAIIK